MIVLSTRTQNKVDEERRVKLEMMWFACCLEIGHGMLRERRALALRSFMLAGSLYGLPACLSTMLLESLHKTTRNRTSLEVAHGPNPGAGSITAVKQ